ncbi:MAG: (Fe-S)-binding protein [Alphaproteobacteria bacterium]|nr:(Fe-S)-binding protein [Alphaproteobacteria bacterium]
MSKSEKTDFEHALDRRVAGILDACTACGACVEVCPTPGIAGIGAASETVAAGVLDILRNGSAEAEAEQWAQVCCGSGFCIAACQHGINPRFMLMMARRAMKRGLPALQCREAGKVEFKKMTRSAGIISRLQMSPDAMQRLVPSSHPERETPPELIFYTGCNMPKTPHIGMLCLDVLDRLDVHYEVYGGPANCCGIYQMRQGDLANGGRQLDQTIKRYADTGAPEVLSWCPTCQIQFDEAADTKAFDTAMFPVYLARRLDDLRPMFTTPVNKRVALREFPGSAGVTESVVALLSAIPGLEVVELEMPDDVPLAGYTMFSLGPLPEFRKKLLAESFRAAERAGVTTLAGIYHGDHRELAAHEGAWPFEFVNYMELVGAAMGISHDDTLKRLKLMRDVDVIMEAVADQIDAYDLDPDEVRDVIANDLLAEQILPTDPARHSAVSRL